MVLLKTWNLYRRTQQAVWSICSMIHPFNTLICFYKSVFYYAFLTKPNPGHLWLDLPVLCHWATTARLFDSQPSPFMPHSILKVLSPLLRPIKNAYIVQFQSEQNWHFNSVVIHNQSTVIRRSHLGSTCLQSQCQDEWLSSTSWSSVIVTLTVRLGVWYIVSGAAKMIVKKSNKWICHWLRWNSHG